jgi:hypothetical protein
MILSVNLWHGRNARASGGRTGSESPLESGKKPPRSESRPPWVPYRGGGRSGTCLLGGLRSAVPRLTPASRGSRIRHSENSYGQTRSDALHASVHY